MIIHQKHTYTDGTQAQTRKATDYSYTTTKPKPVYSTKTRREASQAQLARVPELFSSHIQQFLVLNLDSSISIPSSAARSPPDLSMVLNPPLRPIS